MTPRAYALATDLYELTMAAGYYSNRVSARATFELFVRHLPKNRNYLIVAGIEDALAYLEALHFTDADVRALQALPALHGVGSGFFERLRSLRFTGEVWAMPEGTIAFQGEPLMRVTAPIIEAQLIETFLLATVNFQTMIASKAARVVHAAAGRRVVEFGSRRAHGSEAALYAARAAYVGGCAGTSNVEAAVRFGIPAVGTMAHSWVMAFDDEMAAFKTFMAAFPDSATLLLDTYDTAAAARKIVAAGLRPSAVRLDSGDVDQLSRIVRRILDDGGLRDTQIFVSGDLDEWQIATLMDAGAPIDAFGVGTRLTTSFDAPALGGVYKLVEVDTGTATRGCWKSSEGKATVPGRKQVWRQFDRSRDYAGDMVASADESGPAGAEPLLQCVMRAGRQLTADAPITAARNRALASLAHLPSPLRALQNSERYPVVFSDRLMAEQQRLGAMQQHA